MDPEFARQLKEVTRQYLLRGLELRRRDEREKRDAEITRRQAQRLDPKCRLEQVLHDLPRLIRDTMRAEGKLPEELIVMALEPYEYGDDWSSDIGFRPIAPGYGQELKPMHLRYAAEPVFHYLMACGLEPKLVHRRLLPEDRTFICIVIRCQEAETLKLPEHAQREEG